MLQEITVEELLKLENAVLIDVRSENEFSQGTIPGAINIPLFTNEERKEIGTVYNQESAKQAMELGLKIAGGKLYTLYEQINRLAVRKPLVLFCWRGGLRSKSLAVVLDIMGLHVLRLSGGYKAYRRHVVRFFEEKFPYRVVVLKGNTGTGKTEILQELKAQGYPVLDLESLANHRGSVFGSIGLGVQPSQKQFESLIYHELINYQEYDYIIVECESSKIGKLNLPRSLVEAMREGTEILIYDTIESRADRLVRQYILSSEAISELKQALVKLKKYLGTTNLNELVQMLEKQEYHEFAVRLMSTYYDKLYGYPNEEQDYEFCINNKNLEQSISKLKDFLDKNFGLPKSVKDRWCLHWPEKEQY